MVDHDQIFKKLLREFFAEFFDLFYPQWAARFDFSQIEWLDKELFLDPPHGEKRSIDVLAKLPVLEPVVPSDKLWLALVHVEVESADSVAPLRRRMFEYYEHLRRDHDVPVLPIGLYLRVGLEGLGWDAYAETFWDEELVRFRYPYVGLPGLNAEEYIQRNNLLGVALTALMRVPPERRVELTSQAIRRLVQCPLNDYKRHLLSECLGTYVPLTADQKLAVEAQLFIDPDPGVRAMSTEMLSSWRQEAIQEGRQQLLFTMLHKRFGPLSEAVRDRVQAMQSEQIDAVAEGLLTARSLTDLGLDKPTS